MFKRTATDLDTQTTATQQRMMRALTNARLLPDCCCCLNVNGIEILFRINISPPLIMIAGLDRVDQCFGLPSHRTSYQWTSCSHIKAVIYTSPIDYEEDVIASVVAATVTSGSNLAFF